MSSRKACLIYIASSKELELYSETLLQNNGGEGIRKKVGTRLAQPAEVLTTNPDNMNLNPRNPPGGRRAAPTSCPLIATLTL